jgi:hypothetical protein
VRGKAHAGTAYQIMAETITLEFLAAQQRRILDEMTSMRAEMASFRDDLKVLTAIVLRHEETLIRILEQVTAMVAQNSRIVDRLRSLDERVRRLEEQPQ